MERKLEFMPTLMDAVAIGTKNAVSLCLAVVLYVLTIWIPYLNVGTTIAMATIPGKLAKGEVINPTFIFGSIYRKRMGDFFLLEGLLMIMMIPAFLFGIIPGLVLSFMYTLALYIMIDTDSTPMDSLHMSNKATYGYKWKMFFLILAYTIAFSIVAFIVSFIVNAIDVDVISAILLILVVILGITCGTALDAVIYRDLFLKDQKVENEADVEIVVEEVVENQPE